MKIAIIDDGVGAFATLNKLKYGLYADYTVKILDNHFPLGNFSRQQLCDIALHCVEDAVQQNFDTVVFSSTALSMAAVKTFLHVRTSTFSGATPPFCTLLPTLPRRCWWRGTSLWQGRLHAFPT